MPTADEMIEAISTFNRDDLIHFYEQIEVGNTPGWAAGKALEHLVLRAFEIDGAEVRWPYPVQLTNRVVEQIDGVIYVDHLSLLVECKDTSNPINVEPIAKLANQLARRPPQTLGLVLSRSGFTTPATILTQTTVPHRILLWNGEELKHVLATDNMVTSLRRKFRHAVEHAIPDFSILPADEDLYPQLPDPEETANG